MSKTNGQNDRVQIVQAQGGREARYGQDALEHIATDRQRTDWAIWAGFSVRPQSAVFKEEINSHPTG